MRRVIVESPFRNCADALPFARACVRDCLKRGESPLASHLLYTQDGVLNDDVPEDRALGIAAGHAWIPFADALVLYVDYGISPGMQQGIEIAQAHGLTIEKRELVPQGAANATAN